MLDDVHPDISLKSEYNSDSGRYVHRLPAAPYAIDQEQELLTGHNSHDTSHHYHDIVF